MTSTTMEHKTVFKASISGSVEAKDSKESEAYMVSVVYSDGSKSDLQKTYEQFIELQGKVYNLLKLKSGYSRKTSRTLISSLPDNNSTIARLLFKDDDLKKMGKIQDFIKEIFTLPQVVSQSEDVLGFFSSSNEEQVPNDRLEEEEKLKRVNKVAEILTGRDPLRNIPEKSSTYETAWKPENLQRLSAEARDNLYQKLNRLSSRRPSKEIPTLPGNKMRPASTDDDLEPKRQPQRPGLRRRPFSVAVGVADLMKETPADTQIINKKANSGKVSRGPVSVDSDLEDPQIRKIASQFGKRVGEGESSPKTTKFVAVSPLLAEQRGEVSLKEGEEVEVLQKESNGWWYVKNDSCEGWAPASFLEPVTTSRSGSPTSTIQPRKSENQESSCKLEDDLDTCPEEAGKEDFENDTPTELQGSQKNFERLVESGSQKQPFDTEMNRRVKFLAVEGIQKRKNPDKNYVYILKVVWSDGAINIIYRQCSDFFFLQENLRREFPDAIGKEIPVLKGRKFTENCHFCFKDGTCKRRQFMNQFCHELINAPDSISRGNAVMTFCRPRSSDVLPHGQSDKNDSKKKEAGADDENVQISGPVVFEQYVVIAEYKKKNKNDISLAAGDLVDVIERNDYGWWLVDNEGELGWAPASYLEPTDDGADITTTKSFAPGKEEVYMSIKSYEAQAGDEMSFDAGVIFNVVEKTLDGWWFVSYQNKEGWAPAMFLRKVESGDGLSTSPVSRKMDELDILSFNGENGDKEGLSRTPPTRRSMVKRTVRKKPKRNSSSDAHRGTESVTDESDGSGKSSKSSRSISVPAMVQPANRKPTPRSPRSPRGVSSPRQSPRPLSRPHSREITSDDIDSLLKMKHTSTTSSGYESSPYGSLSSLVSSDVVFTEENSSYSENIRKSATLPSFENVEEDSARRSTPSPVIPRSQSVTSMARYMQEELSGSRTPPSIGRKNYRSLEQNAKSSSVSSLPAKISPVPVPRKNLRKSTAGISPPRSSGSFTPPRYSPRTRNAVTEDLEQSNSEADFDDNQSGSDSPHDSESPESGSEMKTRSLQHPQGRQADKEPADLLDRFGRSRVYRAVYSYASAEDGEVSFNAGDEIEVIQRSDNGWWLVRTVDELGWGPSNFLEVAAF